MTYALDRLILKINSRCHLRSDWIRCISYIDLYRLLRSRSSSRWDFHFHSYVLTIYVPLYWLLELVVFYSLVRRGYIRKVSVQLVPNFFHVIAVLIVFHAASEKNRKKTILKQDSKSRKEYQNFVVIANPPGFWSLNCRSAVAPLLLRCRSAVSPLLLRYCSIVAPLLSLLLLLPSRTGIAPLSLRRCCSCCC